MPFRKTFAAALALCAAASLCADDKKTELALDDATFVKMAASGGMFEIAAAKTATAAAKNPEAKKFAEQMIADHTKAAEELKAAAKAAGVDVPTQMSEKHQQMLKALTDAKGGDFDKAYFQTMVKSHEESAALFTRAPQAVKSRELKDFAHKTLLVVEKHLEMAKKHAKQ
jgi:putative membrane protein